MKLSSVRDTFLIASLQKMGLLWLPLDLKDVLKNFRTKLFKFNYNMYNEIIYNEINLMEEILLISLLRNVAFLE